MGNYRFKLSDMMPNAWFYKLKYITKKRIPTGDKKHHPTTTAPPPVPTQPRRSYHITRDKFSPAGPKPHSPDPPRNSSKKRRSTRRTTTRHQSPRLPTTTTTTTTNSVSTKPNSTPENYPVSPPDSSSEKDSFLPELDSGNPVFSFPVCPCKFDQATRIENHNKPISSKVPNHNGFDLISDIDLPLPLTQIITKTKQPRKSAAIEERNKYQTLITKEPRRKCVRIERNEYEMLITKEPRRSSVRGFSVSSPAGLKLRTISPRIVNRNIQGNGRKSLSSKSRRRVTETIAVVKRSDDPQRDFKESMVEMIMENEIRTSKDLEDLLACYLSLNSDEYHDVIIKVFKQIWFDVTDVRVK